MHNESMPNVLIRDLPPKVHKRLQSRAQSRGQSLQQYLVTELTRMAEKLTMDEWLAQVEGRKKSRIGAKRVLDVLDAERTERTKRVRGGRQ